MDDPAHRDAAFRVMAHRLEGRSTVPEGGYVAFEGELLVRAEYQKRYVQMLYHEGVNNSHQWTGSFCYPEGFIRWWAWPSRGTNFELSVTPAKLT